MKCEFGAAFIVLPFIASVVFLLNLVGLWRVVHQVSRGFLQNETPTFMVMVSNINKFGSKFVCVDCVRFSHYIKSWKVCSFFHLIFYLLSYSFALALLFLAFH